MLVILAVSTDKLSRRELLKMTPATNIEHGSARMQAEARPGQALRQVTALDGVDFELRAGEILAVIGDNGAGKSSLIKALSGATIPDEGEIGSTASRCASSSPIEARRDGIETVYQDLAVAPAMTIAENLFLGRELVKPGSARQPAAHPRQEEDARAKRRAHGRPEVGIRSMTQAVETLSGGQRQCVAVARSAAFARHVVIIDEPTAALGVKEGNMVLELIRRVRDKGLPVILISHNMPHVFEIADRIHIARLGKRAAVVEPEEHQHERHGRGDDRRHAPGRLPAKRCMSAGTTVLECSRTPLSGAEAADAAAPARLQPGRACASSTSAWCCRRSACTAACPRPRSRG